MTVLDCLNVAARLAVAAQERPDAVAVAVARGYDASGRRQYDQVTFAELDQLTDWLARGLVEMGAAPGTRLALLVRPGIELVALAYALLKAGAVMVLVDPGMGRRNLLRCLQDAEPEGFLAIPAAQAVRTLLRRRFRRARLNVTIGRKALWGGITYTALRDLGRRSDARLPETRPEDPAAIIFTSGSTGPPKGVLYCHGNFDAQVSEIRDHYGIEPGEVDLACFPMFGLFDSAMGVTSVVPDMDAARPARVDPRKILEAARDWRATQAFASPAVWNRVGRYCETHGLRLPTLRRVLSSGAPLPVHVLARMKACIDPEGEMFTPYGATEALPVASIAASRVLTETGRKTGQGAGVCVGQCFPLIEWKVIRIVDGPIAAVDEAVELPCGQIGELIVKGPVVTQRYVTAPEWNARAKIADGDGFWHRMGDTGYLDEQGRFWFCGRVAHRVLTSDGPLYPIRCEAIFNRHEAIERTALVGVGRPGSQRAVLIAEPRHMPRWPRAWRSLVEELRTLGARHELTRGIDAFLLHRALPVDVRHNSKIVREKLAVWAARKLKVRP